jgi:hypothetical protein
MRTTQDISKDIHETGEKISALTGDIEKLEAELKESRQSHIRLVSQTAGQERKPKSLDAQRSKIRDLEIEIDSNKEAVKSLQKDLQVFEAERDLSEIFAGPYQAYRESHEKFINRVDQVRTLFDKVLEAGNELRATISASLSSSPLSSLATVFGQVNYDAESLKELGGVLPLDIQKLFVGFCAKEKEIEAVTRSIAAFTSMLSSMDQHKDRLDQQLQAEDRKRIDRGPEPAHTGGTRGHFVTSDGNSEKAPRSTGIPELRMHATRKARAA